MNRRNFLKLFGLLAVPTTALSTTVLPEPSKAIRIARLDISANLYALFDVYVGREKYNHILIGYNGYNGKATETYLVPENALITVRAPSGKSVSFYPQFDTVSQRFKTVDIEFEENRADHIVMNWNATKREFDKNYEYESVIGWITASCAGKNCTESFETLKWTGEKGTFPPF